MKKNFKETCIASPKIFSAGAMLVMLISLLTLLVSCKLTTPVDPLEYQKYPLSAKGSLCANNSEYVFELTMPDKNSAQLKFTSPETLRGYVFNMSGDKTTLSYGDMTIDYNGGNDKTNVVKLLPYLLSLESTMQKSLEQGIEQNSVVLTKAVYTKDSNEIAVYINEETKKPMRFEYNGLVINISEFTPGETVAPSTPNPTPAATSDQTPMPTPGETQSNG